MAPSMEGDRPTHDRDDLAVRFLALAIVTLIPIQILSQGYLPPDDALRHAAKAVSGRSWDAVLLLRPGSIDFSPGWHAILRALHLTTKATAPGIAQFEVATLFIVFSLGPILLLRRAEGWLLALGLVSVLEPQMVLRLTLGRPLILSMGVTAAICLLWPRLDVRRPSIGTLSLISALIAAATWIHGSWYLFALPIVAFFLAGRRHAAQWLLVATGVGVLFGALLTGMPLRFLWANVLLMTNIFGGGVSEWVSELRAYPGAPLLILATTAIIIARKVWRGEPAATLRHDPVFVLAALGWLLGLRSARFWMDWGTPALLVFIALEFEALWLAFGHARRRLVPAIIASVVCFLAITGNVNDRWSNPPRDPIFRTLLNPDRSGTLPDSGGILYSDDKRIFYDLFFLRPNAPWRYSTGFAPEMMPPEDLEVYRRAVTTGVEALEPWARRMRPADRMVIRDYRGTPPFGWLEWQFIGDGLWSGRLPRP
jgi:hypothetical protein